MSPKLDTSVKKSYNNTPATPYPLEVRFWLLLRCPNDLIGQNCSKYTRNMEKT